MPVLDRLVERRGEIAPPRPYVLPAADVEAFDYAPRDPVELEGQCFGIEYVDGEGFASSRIVTARLIKYAADGVPILGAKCQARQAYREFRCDRIEECWDIGDGACEDPRDFLLDALGVDILAHARPEQVDPAKMAEVMTLLMPHIVLLAALSKCDGQMRASEVAEITGHCQRTAGVFSLSDDEAGRIETRVRRVRPDDERIGTALERMRSRPPPEVMAFLVAAAAVVRADGRVLDVETDLLDDLAEELTGLPIGLTGA